MVIDEMLVKPLKLFAESFRKFNLHIVQAAVFDFLFYSGLLLIYLLALRIFGSILNMGISIGESLAPVITSFFLGFVLVLILLFANLVVFKNIVWNRTAQRKTKFYDFFRLSAATVIPFAAVYIVLLVSVTPSTSAMVILALFALLYLYFITISRVVFNGNVRQTIVKAFEVGTFKVHKIIFPVILVFFVFWVLSIITSFLIKVNDNLYFAVTSVIFILFVAWARYYFMLTVNDSIGSKPVQKKRRK